MTSSARRHLRDYFKHRVSLHCPQEEEIVTAFGRMPATGRIEISCALVDLPAMLGSLEQTGFFGLTIQSTTNIARGVQVTAFKGKEQPCFDTGRTATYRGAALAALDDDRHLLFGETAVCEKTAMVYSLPCYKKLVRVSPANPGLLARLNDNPQPFDCDTFEQDASRLAGAITAVTTSDDHQAILYPGPFKMLILQDGSMVARGRPTSVSQAQALQLQRSDDCLALADEFIQIVRPAENFAERYNREGPLCLLDGQTTVATCTAVAGTDFSILRELPKEMRQRLLNMVDSQADYFIMTGSDSRDLDGCCPSDGVRSANHLVEAGILQCARSANGQDVCPVNIYAFSGEIQKRYPAPEFSRNAELRGRVQQYLLNNAASSTPRFISVLRWTLLLFVAATLGVFAANFSRQVPEETSSDLNLVEALRLPFESGILVLQFHRMQRCAFCDDMEAHTRAALASYFPEDIRDHRIAYRLVNMELPQFQRLRREHDIFTSTLMFIEFSDGKEVRSRVVTDAWDLTDRRDAFIRMFRAELSSFRAAAQ